MKRATIGLLPQDEIRKRALAIARGDYVPKPDEPKIWLTAIIEREGREYVALCPEFDIASQGKSIEDAHKNLQEALELFLETADPKEIKKRPPDEVLVTRLGSGLGR